MFSTSAAAPGETSRMEDNCDNIKDQDQGREHLRTPEMLEHLEELERMFSNDPNDLDSMEGLEDSWGQEEEEETPPTWSGVSSLRIETSESLSTELKPNSQEFSKVVTVFNNPTAGDSNNSTQCTNIQEPRTIIKEDIWEEMEIKLEQEEAKETTSDQMEVEVAHLTITNEDSTEAMCTRILEQEEVSLINLFQQRESPPQLSALKKDETLGEMSPIKLHQKEKMLYPNRKIKKKKTEMKKKAKQTRPPSQGQPPRKKKADVTGERLRTETKLIQKMIKNYEKKMKREEKKLEIKMIQKIETSKKKYKRSMDLKAKKEQEESRKEIEKMQKELDKTLEIRTNLLETATIQMLNQKEKTGKIKESLERNMKIFQKDRKIVELLLEARSNLNREISAWMSWQKYTTQKIPKSMTTAWSREFLTLYASGSQDLNMNTLKSLREQETIQRMLKEETQENLMETATMRREVDKLMTSTRM